jgi:hypothetical protein
MMRWRGTARPGRAAEHDETSVESATKPMAPTTDGGPWWRRWWKVLLGILAAGGTAAATTVDLDRRVPIAVPLAAADVGDEAKRVAGFPYKEDHSKPHVIEKKNSPRAASYASR